VQDDDIGGLGLAGCLRDVEESACDLVRQPGLVEQAAASASQFGEISRLVTCAAPRRSSSTWSCPTPPPISRTVARSIPREATKPAIPRAARGQAPPVIALGLTSREAAGKDRLIIVRIAALGHGVSISP